MTIVPNSGIMSDDRLDELRSNAVRAHQATPLPEDVIYYLRALENRYLDRLHEDKKRAAREIGWRFADPSAQGLQSTPTQREDQ